MVRRLAAVGAQLIPVVVYAVLTAGCGGNSSSTVTLPPPQQPPGPAVSGTVLMPNGRVAFEPSLLQRLAALAVQEVMALSGNVSPVGRNVEVHLTRRRGDGFTQELPGAFTNDQGQYRLTLPTGSSEDDCRFIVSVGANESLTRAFVFNASESGSTDIDFVSEAAVRLVFDQVINQGANLCAYRSSDLKAIVDAIRQISGSVQGDSAAAINAAAYAIAKDDPVVKQKVGQPLNMPTPVDTSTRTITPTPTDTPTATTTFTRLPTNTPGIATNTSTRAPTSTVTSTRTSTATATRTATPTSTATVTRTVVPTATFTSTATSTALATVTATNTPTSTPTQGVAGPHITIGDASGDAGSQVTVPISLTSNGPSIVTVAPLVLTFDDSVLTFGSCTKGANVSSGKSVNAAMPSAGRITIALSGDLVPLADGEILECTFTLAAGASGSTPLTFVSGGLSDADFNDYDASGTNGSVTVGSGTPPTATPVSNGPHITIGDVNGAAGSQVTVPISLTSNGPSIVTVAPLVLTFDDSVLTFGSCTKGANVSSGKSVNAAMPSAGRITIALSGDLVALTDGEILDCTFTLAADASGSTPLTFVSGGLSDADFNDYDASGTNGSVTVGSGTPPTATPVSSGPRITIGNVNGAAGSQVTVPISLTSNGPSIVTVAPLVLTFDTNVLTFGSCTKGASVSSGKSVNAAMPSAGRITIALSGDLVALADGEILDCTFTLAAGASGSTPLTFVSGGLSDADFNDYDASGTNGSVTVGSGTPPTATATPSTAAPLISIGSINGTAGSQVTVPVSLTSNGPQIVTIAPLVIGFDASVLTFGSCTKSASVSGGKSVNAAVAAPGRLSIALSGDLVPIPDGEVLACTFTIAAGATGSTPVTFMSAGLSDADFNDIDASGTSGAVTTGGGALPTATATPGVAGPRISIGNINGAAGAQVSVPISLTSNGPQIVTIAPLVITFDTGFLTAGTCTKAAGVSGGKSVNTAVASGKLTIALSGDLVALVDGEILDCTFTIAAGASGSSALTFVSGGLSDAAFNDYDASGTNGSVTVGNPVPPTATPTPGVSGPSITIGNINGAAGAQVSVPISLTSNGPQIVTIAPLVITFDTSFLTAGTCTKAAGVSGGKSVNTAVASGKLTIALSGDLVALVDGEILDCTFTIAAGASGSSALTFVSGGLSDAAFNDYDASGTNGSVTVGNPVPPTATPTPGVSGPSITIGNINGAAGAQVSVPISLTSNGPQIVTIAPLVITFDTSFLTAGTCTKAAGVSGGKSVNTAVASGKLTIALSGDLVALVDGEILDCTFTIAAGASGSSALTFVSGGLSDAAFNDYDASGTNGSVTVGSAVPPTPTVVPPTSVPATATPLATPTATPESGATAIAPTATPTTSPGAPRIIFGRADGAAGSDVMVGIGFMSNGKSVVAVAPLVIGFDSAVVTFKNCVVAAGVSAGKSVSATVPTAGSLHIMLSGDLVPLPDDQILTCTFTISATAAAGQTALTFESAQLSDEASNNFQAAGASGFVTVQ